MELKGIVALVTGGASGLGEATVRRLVKAGAHAIIADRDAAKGEALQKELAGGATFVPVDVTKTDDVNAALTAAEKQGQLRVVVNCAGVGWASRTLNKEGVAHELDLYTTVITINLIGTFNVLRLSAAHMAKLPPLEFGERGVIVNTASVAAYDGQIGQVAYSSSKAGIVGLTLPAARDLSAVGVRVMTIAPGTFDTPMLALLPEQARASLAAGVPFPKRLGSPNDYAALVEHIAQNGYLNGEVIRLDGALRMAPK